MKYSVLIMLIFMFSHTVTATDIYRFVDEDGRVQYSQFPPYKDAEKIHIKADHKNSHASNNSSQSSLRERQEKYSNYLKSERLERKQKRQQIKQEKAELAANCYSVRADLEDMQQGGVIYYDLDENGDRVYIDESRIEEKKQRLSRYLDKNCKTIVNN